MSRLSADGETLAVRTEAGLPRAIHWNGSWQPVQHVALTWQLDLCWWRARIYRDYYKLLGGGHGAGDLSRPADRQLGAATGL